MMKKIFSKEQSLNNMKTLFFVGIFEILIIPIEHLSYVLMNIPFDISEYDNYIFKIIYLIIMFVCMKLLKKETILGGIVGIVAGLMMIIFSGLLWKIFGIIIIINSVLYLISYNKS